VKLHVTSSLAIPFDELSFSFALSSGPGGQNVNKVNSKAILAWNIMESPSISAAVRSRFLKHFGKRVTARGEILIASQSYRDQARNKEACLAKLLAMMQEAARPPKRRIATKPSKAAVERRLESKKALAKKKSRRRTSREFE
jgi:ribosome-associated protein